MEWCEPTLWSHVRVMIILQETTQEWVSDTKVRNKILVLSWSFQNSISLPFLDTYTSKITHIFAIYFSLNKSLVEGWEFKDVSDNATTRFVQRASRSCLSNSTFISSLEETTFRSSQKKKQFNVIFIFIFIIDIF